MLEYIFKSFIYPLHIAYSIMAAITIVAKIYYIIVTYKYEFFIFNF